MRIPCAFRRGASPQVEFLGVDADVHVGPLREHAREQLAADAQQARQVRQDLEQPHHGEIFGALPGLAAGGDHARPGDAGEPRARQARAQRFDQVRAELVAGGFAGDENDEQGCRPLGTAQRTIPTRSRRGVESLRNVDERRQLRLRRPRAASSCSVASCSFSSERYRIAVRVADVADLLGRVAAPLQALGVDAVRLGRPADGHDERRHVARHRGVVGDERVRADLAELVHAGEAAHVHPVADLARARRASRSSRTRNAMPTTQSCATCE